MMLAPHALFLRRWLLQEGTRLFRRKASGSMVLTATLRLPSHANIERDLVRTSNEYFSTSCVNCAKSRELKGKRDISEKKLVSKKLGQMGKPQLNTCPQNYLGDSVTKLGCVI